MSPEQLDRFEALLEQSDPDIYEWIVGRSAAPTSLDTDVLAMLRAFHGAAGPGAVEQGV